jgi:hypothetical protein
MHAKLFIAKRTRHFRGFTEASQQGLILFSLKISVLCAKTPFRTIQKKEEIARSKWQIIKSSFYHQLEPSTAALLLARHSPRA